ncbi:MAG: ABC transporter ATP-binding protein [Armatimonadetes bacterium]|nr:ABC transporter ATP-binding protein [Armatimonadota bacterium]
MIDARELEKKYGEFSAVDDLSFRVERGEVFGFLGPNGAGKTTTIRMLTGQTSPTRGEAFVAGCHVVREKDSLKTRIGVLFEEQNLYERLSARINLVFFCKIFGLPDRRADEVLDQMGLSSRKHKPVQTFSKGMRQRLLLARTLLSRPQVLFLDEPTSGLDPHSAREVRDLIRTLTKNDATIFLTTHSMEEADSLCHRVAIMDHGKMVACDTPSRLKGLISGNGVRVCYRNGDRDESDHLSLEDPGAGKLLERLLLERRLVSIHSSEASLEDVFLNLTGHPLEE